MKQILLSVCLVLGVVAVAPAADASGMVLVFEQRTVVISAQNSGEANLRAMSQNPGWTATSARLVGNNQWEVTIQRNR